MNNDLISRSAAIKAVTGWDSEPTDEELERVLNKLPAVDAEPVRHGKWLEPYKNDIWDCYRCSECGAAFDRTTKYCSNCGAKMDAEVQSEGI